MSALTSRQTPGGTMAYAAPEVHQGRIGDRTDQFALAVTYSAASRDRDRDYENVKLLVDVLGQVRKKYAKELTPEEKQKVFTRLEEETKRDYGADVTIHDPPPPPGVQFGYALNLSIGIGGRKCAEACHRENNHDRPSYNSYIRVFEMTKGGANGQGLTYANPLDVVLDALKVDLLY